MAQRNHDEAKAQAPVFRLVVGALLVLVALALFPILIWLVGAAALVAFPVTFAVLLAVPYFAFRATRGLKEGDLWVVLSTLPLVGHASIYFDSERVFQFLSILTGGNGSTTGNLAPPTFGGIAIGLEAAYIALINTALLVRLHFSRP